jgi:gliding motility-associated-like protein
MFTVATLPDEPMRPSYLSTTLSPNAANVINRAVRLQGADLVDNGFEFEVYNRWGNQLFRSTSLSYMSTTGWDGTQAGQLLPSGAYPYRAAYRDRTGKEIQQTGFITIVY